MKLWFVPLIVVFAIFRILSTTYTVELISISPEKIYDNKILEKKIISKNIELKLVSKSKVVINGVIGGIFGWVVSKFLDFGFFIIKRRRLEKNA